MRYALALLLAGCAGGGVGDIGSTTETYEGPFETLLVESNTGRIELVAGDDDGTVSVEFLPNGSDTWEATEDGDLTLTATCLGDDVAGCGGGFIITVPPGQDADLRTQTGEIDLGAGLSGELNAQTASNSILGTDLGAASVTALTGTGSVELTFADTPAAVDVDTGSSPITITVPGGGYALDIDTNGEKSVGAAVTDDPSGPKLRAHSGTGDITIDGA